MLNPIEGREVNPAQWRREAHKGKKRVAAEGMKETDAQAVEKPDEELEKRKKAERFASDLEEYQILLRQENHLHTLIARGVAVRGLASIEARIRALHDELYPKSHVPPSPEEASQMRVIRDRIRISPYEAMLPEVKLPLYPRIDTPAEE